jgi:hypothetical protein
MKSRSAWPSMWAIIFLALCCTAATFITFRAAAQNAAAAAAAAKPAIPQASKPEESATIPDDPTLVPDPKESADNNVSFPVDI